MRKIVTILGARPQFVKASVISRNIIEEGSVKEIIVHTGQHFDSNMSDVFFDELGIPSPKYNLNIHSLSHGAMTGQMLEKIEAVLKLENPDYVLVYGDTNSTLAGALAAKKMHIKVAHVEAGLRSFNIKMPEEINRILSDRISDLLFCPTKEAVNNLLSEGFGNLDAKIINSGDIMYDASLYFAAKSRKPSVELPEDFVLCTIHRGENTDNSEVLLSIMEALETISNSLPIVMPIHPRTRAILTKLNYPLDQKNIYFIDPVGYFEMISLIQSSKLIITDSGGLQKEAYFFGKNCLIARNETEWIELVDNGYNFICGTDAATIVEKFNILKQISNQLDFTRLLYGDGNAGKIILREIIEEFQ